MGKNDAYLIVLLIIIAVALALGIMVKNAHLAVMTEPQQTRSNVLVIFEAPRTTDRLSLDDVLMGVMMLGSSKDVSLNESQKTEIQKIIGDMRPKQEEFKTFVKSVDGIVKKMANVLTERQKTYIHQNMDNLRMGLSSDEAAAPGQNIIDMLEKDLFQDRPEKTN
ncbi:MAG: hypothetical protein RDV48_18700 [Candidatus Eremiobacteraeota bacterium]|nr:hypothetical protein [Candidatus Eremiobacteraeota bacterium]